MRDESIRTFIALVLPAEVRRLLTHALRELDALTEPGSVRWVKPEHLHLTVKFLGDTPEPMVPAVGDLLQEIGGRVRAPELYLVGLGAFPAIERPRVLWAGLGGDVDGVFALFRMLEEGLSGLGIPREARPLSPHITLGRVRDRMRAPALSQVSAAVTSAHLESPVFRSEELVFFRSMLTPWGPIYEALAQVTISG